MNLSRGFVKDYLIDNRAVKLTGRISYGIYLYHIPVQFYVKAFLFPAALAMGFDPGFPVWLVLDLALVWIISYFSYQYIEKPFLRYKDRFSISAT
jgi:peptidoglycan/LPS O-acetylase OafA/YrhL